jgi:hypothetical protein
MFGLIRSLITLVLVLGVAYCGATVPLGQRTFFQHVAQIWKTDEAQEFRQGVQETSVPVVERVKRGVQAGVDEARRERDGGAEPVELQE